MQGLGLGGGGNSPGQASHASTTRGTLGHSDSRGGSVASSVSELLGSYVDDGAPWLPSPTGGAAGGGSGIGVVDRLDSAHYEVRPAGLLERQDSAHEVSKPNPFI